MPTTGVLALEQAIVRHCSPTLAALKPASLFTFPGFFVSDTHSSYEKACAERSCFSGALEACSHQLQEDGIRMRVLVWRTCGALVYVYRPDMLASYLADPRAAATLRDAGYPLKNLEDCIDLLAVHIAHAGNGPTISCPDIQTCPYGEPCDERDRGCEFPHEIGYFLGYPYTDVAEFIRQRGKNYLTVGLWKVYSDREQALATFARYKRCARAMMHAYRRRGRLSGLAARV